MGMNSTVVVMNDALHEIEHDPKFGEKLARAIMSHDYRKAHNDVSAGCHCNAAEVITVHHADDQHLIAVGGNTGKDLGFAGGYRDKDLDLMKRIAHDMGYRLVKRSR